MQTLRNVLSNGAPLIRQLTIKFVFQIIVKGYEADSNKRGHNNDYKEI